jgi:hypothetical protein
MKICFFRSSSYNAHDFCNQRYFLEYTLGYRFDANAAADRGTIFHKIMEILAIIKKAQQEGKKSFQDEEILGKRRLTKKIDIDKITDEVFEYYRVKLPHQDFGPKDLKDIKKWVTTIREFRNGLYWPLNQDIFEPEQKFEFPIEQQWAKYSYDFKGEKLSGYLGLKGTIDLMVKVDDQTLHIVDYKTGRRLDWATGKEKTYDKLMTDPQLRIYHYAASYLYPQYESILVTIFFVKDGGPFTLCFSPHHLAETEEMLKKKFEKIRDTQIPRLNKSWKCTKMCPYSKNSFDNPMIEFRNGQFTQPGQPMSMCQQAEYMIKQKGINWVEDNYVHPSHELDFYKAPGSV